MIQTGSRHVHLVASEAPAIPEISDERLLRLARRVRPVISLIRTPLGRYPEEEIYTYYLPTSLSLEFLRQRNFLGNNPRLWAKRQYFVEETTIETLHIPGSAGRVFHPTIAEVLAQIPESLIYDESRPAGQIVAFETHLEEFGPRYNTGGLHVAITRLLSKGSPRSGYMCRFYS